MFGILEDFLKNLHLVWKIGRCLNLEWPSSHSGLIFEVKLH